MSIKFTRRFTEEERVAFVKEAMECGSNAVIAAKYNIHPHQLSNWKSNYRKYHQTIKPKDCTEKEVIADYKKEYKRLLEETKEKDLEIAVLRDLLKKNI